MTEVQTVKTVQKDKGVQRVRHAFEGSKSNDRGYSSSHRAAEVTEVIIE
jgi:hypothetical protein